MYKDIYNYPQAAYEKVISREAELSSESEEEPEYVMEDEVEDNEDELSEVIEDEDESEEIEKISKRGKTFIKRLAEPEVEIEIEQNPRESARN